MTTKDLALNFVSQFNKPFDLGTISSLIGRSPRSVKPVLDELLTAKQIRLVDPEQGIYVRDNRYLTSVCYHQKGNWQFKPEAASALLDHIEKGNYTSVRGVAKDFPRSRQWVFVYMEALASMGILDYDECYVVKTRDNLKDIGKVVKKGALNDLGYRSNQRPRTYKPLPGEDEETHLRRLAEARIRIAAFEKSKLKI
ncbi:MAG: hypothetical protein CVU48_06000 [Candidatus Cloacimonetes bacterium HGW-Cloacimonetes-1]|jgi:hypothetical protein|nr:MAG: hypothetical protein CVU48_06000 [Candidatus Cloacimonetes bacterium HGW-Cloacimonetes-1]